MLVQGTCKKGVFASPLSQKYEVISKLSQIKLTSNTDVYQYISEIRSIISSFETLKIDIDTVLQYFVWHSMNDKF